MPTYTPENDETKGKRRLLAATLFLVLSLVVANLPPSQQRPLAAGLRASVLRPFILVQETLARARIRSVEAERLQAELDSLAARLGTRTTLAEENARLRALLGLSRRLGPSFTAASAMRPGTVGSESVFMLDVGTEDGVREGAPVIVQDGLIGVVLEVHETSSLGMDWTHPDFRASAMVAEGEAYGIVEPRRGDFREEDRLVLNGVPFYTVLREGSAVVTSGLGGVYPRGIPIGEILELAETEGRWRKSYWIRPFVSPGGATHVLVAVVGDGETSGEFPELDTIWAEPPEEGGP